MSTEEPAWKAELKSAVLNAVIDSEQFRGVRWTPTTDAVLEAIVPHIKAAEERGRQQALREGATRLRARAVHDVLENCVPCATHRFDADLIDPDRP